VVVGGAKFGWGATKYSYDKIKTGAHYGVRGIATPFVLTGRLAKYIGGACSPTIRGYLDRRQQLRLGLKEGSAALVRQRNREREQRKRERHDQKKIVQDQKKFRHMLQAISNRSEFKLYALHAVSRKKEIPAEAKNQWNGPGIERIHSGEGSDQVWIYMGSSEVKDLVKLAAKNQDLRTHSNLETYLGSLVIDEARLTPNNNNFNMHESACELLIEYQSSAIQNRMNTFYQAVTEMYSKGDTTFLDEFSRLNNDCRTELLYRILGEDRVPEIDMAIEQDEQNIELLEEAGRRKLREERNTRTKLEEALEPRVSGKRHR